MRRVVIGIGSALLVGLLSGCGNQKEATPTPSPYAKAMALKGQGQSLMLEVGASSCYACIEMKQLIDKLHKENPDHRIFVINLNEEREVAKILKIQVIPTQIVYDASGEEAWRHVGGLSESELRELVQRHGI